MILVLLDASSIWQVGDGGLPITTSGCVSGVSLSPFHWWEHQDETSLCRLGNPICCLSFWGVVGSPEALKVGQGEAGNRGTVFPLKNT